MDTKILALKQIYTIQMNTESYKGKYIVYLPIQGYATIVEEEVLKNLCRVVGGEDIDNPRVKNILSHLNDEKKKIFLTPHSESGLLNMMILPNNKCNFNCSYCYSAAGRSGKEISLKTLMSALDYFLDEQRAVGERLTISVLGGGEPMLSWKILKPVLDHAYCLADKRNKTLPISLVTNGSIVTDDMLDYCKSHGISVSVSFDILEDVQNSQRGHYDTVRLNINRLTEYGLDIAINTVITNTNVNRMSEMINHLNSIAPGVKKVSFKSLISSEYFSSIEDRKKYYHTFIDNFFEAQSLAEKLGIYLTSPYQNASMCLADRYCPGKFVVTAEGTVSICHCVSSSSDLLHDKFVFGKIKDAGKIEIDHTSLSDILSHNQNYYERCNDCPARWNCAGGCYTDNCTMNSLEHNAYCDSMRYFLEKYLLKNVIKDN